MPHRSASRNHYDWEAPAYDLFNEVNSRPLNRLIERILRHHGVKSVLDMTCGTGSQVFWLARHGFRVVGCDISAPMLRLARRKEARRAIRLVRGDMRTFQGGPVDAVLTISNAVGHLTKSDFERAIRNIRANLAPGGVYVFDIYNLDYLLAGDNISRLTIDWTGTIHRRRHRQIQYSTIDARGILTSFTTTLPDARRLAHTLQVYPATELEEKLRRNGFKVARQSGIDGAAFSPRKTERLLTVATLVGRS